MVTWTLLFHSIQSPLPTCYSTAYTSISSSTSNTITIPIPIPILTHHAPVNKNEQRTTITDSATPNPSNPSIWLIPSRSQPWFKNSGGKSPQSQYTSHQPVARTFHHFFYYSGKCGMVSTVRYRTLGLRHAVRSNVCVCREWGKRHCRANRKTISSHHYCGAR